jgi:hypothetical protein
MLRGIPEPNSLPSGLFAKAAGAPSNSTQGLREQARADSPSLQRAEDVNDLFSETISSDEEFGG